MATRKQISANRANARKSTGPLSDIGLERVSRNARKHGLTGAFEVLEGEDQEMFDALLNQLMKEEEPACLAEVELVKKMAEHTWCSERSSRLQEGCFIITRTDEQRGNLEGQAVIHPQLELFMRYQAHHDRAYQRASAELLKRRKERLLADRGFVSQKQSEQREKRCEEIHVYRVDKHKTAVAIDKTKLDLVQIKLLIAQLAAEKEFNGSLPALKRKIAA